ncbi:hypothetical protein TURU_152569 [Turdus rufiventris]|nr:hypothetical protein TURU_152569 [Turdus rufiventris]
MDTMDTTPRRAELPRTGHPAAPAMGDQHEYAMDSPGLPGHSWDTVTAPEIPKGMKIEELMSMEGKGVNNQQETKHKDWVTRSSEH